MNCKLRICAALLIAFLFRIGDTIAAPTTLPSPRPMLADRVKDLEHDITNLIMSRPDVAPDQSAILECRIDLRIAARWFFSVAADAKPESDVQIAGYIRGSNILTAMWMLEESYKKQSPTFTPAQSDAMNRLHQLTFMFPKAESVAQLDEMSRNVGQQLLIVVSPGKTELTTAPMRPKPMTIHDRTAPAPPAQPTVAPASDAPPTLQQLAAESRQVAVSVPLRKQLIALAERATSVTRQNGQEKEAQALYQALLQAMDLARGLQANTGVSPDDRNEIEGRLAEGVALFTDSRTRAAGQSRLDSLAQYRLTVARIGKLHLPAEMTQQFAPMFVWVQQNPEAGQKLLSTMETFVELSIRFSARPKTTSVPPTMHQAIDDLSKSFQSSQSDFVDDGATLGSNGMTESSPAALQKHVDEMRRSLDLMDLLTAMPKTLQTLSAVKPKPTGGLEKRVDMAAKAVGARGKSDEREAADKALAEVVRLAGVVTDLTGRSTSDIPASVGDAYTPGGLSTFDTKWRATAGDLASQLAATGSMDRGKMARLAAAGAMIDGLHAAADMEAALAKASSLQRWVDWSIGVDQLQKVITPYREVTSAAFAGFSSGNNEAIDRWLRVRPRYAALATFIAREGNYADACNALPSGLQGEAAKLMTKLDGQPFDAERYASFAIGVWAYSERKSDFINADFAASALAQRVSQ